MMRSKSVPPGKVPKALPRVAAETARAERVSNAWIAEAQQERALQGERHAFDEIARPRLDVGHLVQI